MFNAIKWSDAFKDFLDTFRDFSSIDAITKAGVIVSFVLLGIFIAATILAFIFAKKNKTELFTTRDLTYGAVCLAMAFTLSFLGFKLPQGGTITFASSLPIMIYCYFFGYRKGIVICTAFMLLQFLQGPYIVHFFSMILDYAIPYLALIFFGIFSKNRFNIKIKNYNINFIIAFLCYVVLRYASHVLSGVIFYGEWAWDGWGVFPYSLAYNSFVLIDGAIALCIGLALLPSKAFDRFMTVPANTLQNTGSGKENN